MYKYCTDVGTETTCNNAVTDQTEIFRENRNDSQTIPANDMIQPWFSDDIIDVGRWSLNII